MFRSHNLVDSFTARDPPDVEFVIQAILLSAYVTDERKYENKVIFTSPHRCPRTIARSITTIYYIHQCEIIVILCMYP